MQDKFDMIAAISILASSAVLFSYSSCRFSPYKCLSPFLCATFLFSHLEGQLVVPRKLLVFSFNLNLKMSDQHLWWVLKSRFCEFPWVSDFWTFLQ